MTDPLSHPTCPDCGTPLPTDSPQALCPTCLMRQALASRTIVHDNGKTPQLPPPSPEEIADRFPSYEILECLGRGGMGVVYKARQKSLNRLVALKLLAPERSHDARFAERFAHEAELLAKLNHPHIVTIHDFGETHGLFYLVMEYVDGINLRDLLRDGKLEPQQALAIVPPICDALQYAHEKGIVHRDIKPENLLLDRDGRVKIADFGIAALIGAGAENTGTPPYMAPEQSSDLSEVDSRADIYALGVVLYEMLTGERPQNDLIAPSKKVQIDVRLDEIVLRALEKTPELRYQTAGDFRTQVEIISEAGRIATDGDQNEPIHTEEWLALIDAGNYAQSWETTTPYFQSSLARDEWIGRLQKVRHPLGRVLTRTQISATFNASGHRFEAKYETSFAGMPSAVETMTFDKQPDGKWLAAGYLIRPTSDEAPRLSRTAIVGSCCRNKPLQVLKAIGFGLLAAFAAHLVTSVFAGIGDELLHLPGKVMNFMTTAIEGIFSVISIVGILIVVCHRQKLAAVVAGLAAFPIYCIILPLVEALFYTEYPVMFAIISNLCLLPVLFLVWMLKPEISAEPRSAKKHQEDLTENSKTEQHPSVIPPRFCRTAIVGACWAPFFFITLFSMFTLVKVSTGEDHGPAWWQYLLRFTVLPLAVTAPFGTTILGWVAVSKIHRSAGKLYGMGLAVFDGLLFPLLTLTSLIAWFWYWVFDDLIRTPITEGGHELSTLERILASNTTAFTVLATLLTSLLVCFLITRRVWRAVNGIAQEQIKEPKSTGNPTKLITRSLFILVSVLMILICSYKYATWKDEKLHVALEQELSNLISTLLAEKRVTGFKLNFAHESPDTPWAVVVHCDNMQSWRSPTDELLTQPRNIQGDIVLNYRPPNEWAASGKGDLDGINIVWHTVTSGFPQWPERKPATPPASHPDRHSPQITAEMWLAELPADFKPTPENMTREALSKIPNVKILSTPSVTTKNNQTATIEVGDSEKNLHSFRFELQPEWDGDLVKFTLKASASESSSPGATNIQEAILTGTAQAGTLSVFDLGLIESGRRVGVVRFSVIDAEGHPFGK